MIATKTAACAFAQAAGEYSEEAGWKHGFPYLDAFLDDVVEEVDDTVGVAPLVVVPRDELDEGRGELMPATCVEDGRARVALEVGGDDLVLGVADDALVLRRSEAAFMVP